MTWQHDIGCCYCYFCSHAFRRTRHYKKEASVSMLTWASLATPFQTLALKLCTCSLTSQTIRRCPHVRNSCLSVYHHHVQQNLFPALGWDWKDVRVDVIKTSCANRLRSKLPHDVTDWLVAVLECYCCCFAGNRWSEWTGKTGKVGNGNGRIRVSTRHCKQTLNFIVIYHFFL